MAHTINLTPSWSGILPGMFAVLDNKEAPAKSQLLIRDELSRMTRGAGVQIPAPWFTVEALLNDAHAGRPGNKEGARTQLIILARHVDAMNAKAKTEAPPLRSFRKAAREQFDGSAALFGRCWRELGSNISDGSIDAPTTLEDVTSRLDSIAEFYVNNPRSRFYIHG